MAEHIIGALADFPPGSQKVISIGKLQVGVFNVDGELYALPNICPHQFGPICTGRVSGTLLSDGGTNGTTTGDWTARSSPALGMASNSTSPLAGH